jgi:hypothetical protein
MAECKFVIASRYLRTAHIHSSVSRLRISQNLAPGVFSELWPHTFVSVLRVVNRPFSVLVELRLADLHEYGVAPNIGAGT